MTPCLNHAETAPAGDGTHRLALRPERAEDAPFLKSLYASTRAGELNLTGWDAATRGALLEMQFMARGQGYRSLRPAADFFIVQLGTEPVGRLVLQRSADEFRVVDIALLPEHRNRGMGTFLLRQVCAQADAAEKPVRLSVMMNNPARRCYERLGFVKLGETGQHELMERPPAATKS